MSGTSEYDTTRQLALFFPFPSISEFEFLSAFLRYPMALPISATLQKINP